VEGGIGGKYRKNFRACQGIVRKFLTAEGWPRRGERGSGRVNKKFAALARGVGANFVDIVTP
jgi:hypothetical protein